MTPARFQKLLLTWFDQHGRKHLPWQQNKTPYRVWVSEIMLQQTQVTTVIPYFERFTQRFPDLTSLAQAHEDEVLHLWAGLGYYSRARNLQRAARLIMEKFAGQFPASLSELQELPGIGQSTAGAILAIAFNQPAAILDGNVKRVLARFHGVKAAINEKNTEKKLWDYAIRYTPNKRIADYTQAMMDLGATLCVRSKPQCTACPLNQDCVAHAHDMTDVLPQKKAKRALPIRIATFLVLKKDKEILLCKRPPAGIWGGLWSLPEVIGTPEKKAIQAFCRQQFRFAVTTFKTLPSFRHTFTHYHLDIHPIVISLNKAPASLIENGQQIWYNPSQPEAIGLPKPIQLIMRAFK